MQTLRVALLHLAPVTGQVDHNRRLVERGVQAAAQAGAHWAVTPELCISGYVFTPHIGTDWILPQPDPWMQEFQQLVRQLGLTVFLSHPERDPQTEKLHNTVFVINPAGEILGKHRKVRTLRGPEGWSSPGLEIDPIQCGDVPVGVMVCADAYKNEVAQVLKEKGARVLVSPASWGLGGCEPRGEWEQRTLDTGLPIMVCNRSGVEADEMDYTTAESVVAQHGRRLLSGCSDRSVVLTFDWDLEGMRLLSGEFQRTYL
ncbi:MAG: carbon-nitrogen hydrolase family protein [SAR202 cluster bacterium]|nr:carbon-nitrogen hydrolase family protein [SAR202 cluster bacterium]